MSEQPVILGASDCLPATAYLIIRDAARAMEFYKDAFGAIELIRMCDPQGKIRHGEIRIGNSSIMMAEEFFEIGLRSPESLGASPVGILLYTEDVDALSNRAVAAGARILRPVADRFFGERTCSLVDPFGHEWLIATRKEVLTHRDIHERAASLYGRSWEG
jgi:PhnB protein